MVAYFAGGYNAGRLSRFDGGRQGLGVWVVGLVITLLIGAAGAIFGTEYNVLAQLQIQPRVPVSEGSLATGGLIALAAIIVGTLLAAILGGQGRRALPQEGRPRRLRRMSEVAVGEHGAMSDDADPADHDEPWLTTSPS